MTTRTIAPPVEIDRANAAFWDELCGTRFAAEVGVSVRSPEALARFDREYLSFYPYLVDYVRSHLVTGRTVLEVGLGYGTLGQHIASTPVSYYGVDLAAGPTKMMEYRLQALQIPAHIVRGNANALPFAPGSFDVVVSIGCLHHTGMLRHCVEEVYRVLRPRGVAVVMLYNGFSYRQWMRSPLRTLMALARERLFSSHEHKATERQRLMYDIDMKGRAAPETTFVSRRGVRDLFRVYSNVTIRSENCDDIIPGGRLLTLRRRLLQPIGRTAGLDLYITATK